MNEWFITFGQSHRHVIAGITFDKDNCLYVRGDYDYAQHVAQCLFNKTYSFIRPIMEFIPEYYPKGLINLDGWSYKIEEEEKGCQCECHFIDTKGCSCSCNK